MSRAKSERVLHIQQEDIVWNGSGVLKGSRSMDSLLPNQKYDYIVNGGEKRERMKRISVSVGKKLLNEVLCDYAY